MFTGNTIPLCLREQYKKHDIIRFTEDVQETNPNQRRRLSSHLVSAVCHGLFHGMFKS